MKTLSDQSMRLVAMVFQVPDSRERLVRTASQGRSGVPGFLFAALAIVILLAPAQALHAQGPAPILGQTDPNDVGVSGTYGDGGNTAPIRCDPLVRASSTMVLHPVIRETAVTDWPRAGCLP